MMDQGPIPSGSVERWDSCSSCPDPFSKSTLKKKIKKTDVTKKLPLIKYFNLRVKFESNWENLQGLFSLQHNILI